MKRNSQKGFTLIEIFIVIILIGVIGTGAFGNYLNSQKNARDARRKIDIETLRQALEVYKSVGGSYPNFSGGISPPSSGTNAFYTALTSGGCGGSGCISTSSYPRDPQNTKQYYYAGTGTTYEICVRLENPDTTTPDQCNIASGDDCETAAGTQDCNFGAVQP